MRSPVRALARHLLWSRHGTVWATWRLNGLPNPLRQATNADGIRAAHEGLLRALPGESLLLGISAAATQPTVDASGEVTHRRRTFWLSVPLHNGGVFGALRESCRAAFDDVRDQLAIFRPSVAPAEVERRIEQARSVEAAIPEPFRPRPATATELVWLYRRALQRGFAAGLEPPSVTVTSSDSGMSPPVGPWPQAVLDEGNQAELKRARPRLSTLLNRRYVTITQPEKPGLVSHQSLLTLAATLWEDIEFPGPVLNQLDASGLDVDWAMRLFVRRREELLERNRRELTKLIDETQPDEGFQSTAHQLERSVQTLAEDESPATDDDLGGDVEATVILCVAAGSGAQAMERAGELQYFCDAFGYRLIHPLGNQEDLWWAMLPGSPLSRSVRELAEITSASAVSAGYPIVTSEDGGDALMRDARSNIGGIALGRP